MVFTGLISKLFRKSKKIKYGEFHCLIGDVDVEIIPNPKKEEYVSKYHKKISYLLSRRMTSILWIEQSEKDVENTQISLPHPFHNFKGDYIIKCSKLNKYWEDDGGCFSVVTNVPGTCLACRQDEIPKELNYNISYADWLLRHHYDYKWCAYMPDINSDRMNENPIAPLPIN